MQKQEQSASEKYENKIEKKKLLVIPKITYNK